MANNVKYWENLKEATLANNLTAVKLLMAEDSFRWEDSLKLVARLAAQKDHLAILQYVVNEEPSILESEYDNRASVAEEAATHGHLNILTFVAEQNPSVLAYANSRWTKSPLSLALQNGVIKNLKMFKFFVEDKNVPLINANELVEVAATKGKLGILKYIVGTDPTLLNRKIAVLAVENGHPNILRYIAQRTPSLLREQDLYGNNILYKMAQRNFRDLKFFQFLEEQGVSLMQTNKEGRDAAYLAAENGNLNLLEYIEKKNPSVLETKYRNGETIAQVAMKRHRYRIVHYIAEKRPNLLAYIDEAGNTILHTAAKNDNMNQETLNFLLERVGETIFSLNATNNYGNTIADVAVRRCSKQIIPYLVERMPSILMTDKLKNPSRMCQCILESRSPHLLKLFIQKFGPVIESRGWCKDVESNSRNIIMQCLVTKNPSPESASEALHSALYSPSLPMVVKYLIEEKKTDVNILNERGEPPLFVALRNGRNDIFRYLTAEQNANLTLVNNDGENILFIAAGRCDLNTIKYVLDNRTAAIDLELRNKLGNTLLHTTAGEPGLFCQIERRSSMDIIKYLVEQKRVDVNIRNKQDEPPLFIALRKGRNDIFRYLAAEKEANLTMVNADEENILFIAAKRGDLNSMKYILDDIKATIDLEWRNKLGNNLLHTTILGILGQVDGRPMMDILKYLVEQKHVDVNIRNQQDEPLLFIALRNGRNDIFRYLAAEQNANLTMVNADGENILFIAARRGDLNSMKYILDDIKAAIDLEWRNKLGNNLLHTTILGILGQVDGRTTMDILKYLVEQKHVDVNVPNKQDEPPLFIALRNGRNDIFRYLAALKEANLTMVNADEENILFIAAKRGDLNSMKYILDDIKAAIDLEWRNKLGNNLLHTTILGILGQVDGRTTVDILKYLVEQKHVDVNARGSEGMTSLHHAALHSNINICHYLRQHGANPDIRDTLGRTYWHYKTLNRSRRNSRSVHHPFAYFPTILPSLTEERIEHKLDSNNSFQIDGVNSSIDNREYVSSQLQNFLTIGTWILGKTRVSLDRNNVPSPLAVVQNKIDAAAMAIVDVIP